MIKEEGVIFKIGLPCCTLGLVMPKVCTKGGGQCLCLKGYSAFPFDDELVPGPICAVCCLQCVPNMGCMKGSKKASGAPDNATMSR